MTRTETWTVEPDGNGNFNAIFDMLEDGKSIGRGAARSGISKEEAEAHVAMAERTNAEREAHAALFRQVQNPDYWKLPTIPKTCETDAEVNALCDAITYFCGGAEVNGRTVTSRGYYFYIGA